MAADGLSLVATFSDERHYPEPLRLRSGGDLKDYEMISTLDFRAVFLRVAADYGLSEESQACAWLACLTDSCVQGSVQLREDAVNAYKMLDRTRPPYEPQP